jgi:hypothetical protein
MACSFDNIWLDKFGVVEECSFLGCGAGSEEEGVSEEGGLDNTMIFIIGGAGGAALILCLCLCLCWRYKSRRSALMAAAAAAAKEEEEKKKADEENAAKKKMKKGKKVRTNSSIGCSQAMPDDSL